MSNVVAASERRGNPVQDILKALAADPRARAVFVGGQRSAYPIPRGERQVVHLDDQAIRRGESISASTVFVVMLNIHKKPFERVLRQVECEVVVADGVGCTKTIFDGVVNARAACRCQTEIIDFPPPHKDEPVLVKLRRGELLEIMEAIGIEEGASGDEIIKQVLLYQSQNRIRQSTPGSIIRSANTLFKRRGRRDLEYTSQTAGSELATPNLLHMAALAELVAQLSDDHYGTLLGLAEDLLEEQRRQEANARAGEQHPNKATT